MANKCLVTRLKAAIQNDDLPLFNTIKMKAVKTTSVLNSSKAYCLSIKSADSGVVLKVDGNGYFANSRSNLSDETKRFTEMQIISTTLKTVYFVNDNYNVFIENASNLRHLQLTGQTVASGRKTLINLDLAELKNNGGLDHLETDYSDVYGSIGNIPSSVTTFTSTTNSGVTGDISLLANTRILDKLFIRGTGISGSIESLVHGQVNLGKNAESEGVDCNGALVNLTFGGVIQTTTLRGALILWEGTEKIIVGAETSKTPSSLNNATTIYAKGATAEEISAWQQAGKTVIVVTDDGE